MGGEDSVLRKSTTRRGPILATSAGEYDDSAPERSSTRISEGASQSPLAELGIGVAMTLLAVLVAWVIARAAADAPSEIAAGALGCDESCSVIAPASTPKSDEPLLSEEWRWGTGDYSFDDIYGRSQMPTAYSYDFVYPRPITGYTVR